MADDGISRPGGGTPAHAPGPEALRRVLEVLEAIVKDRSLLAQLSHEERKALLVAAGRTVHPDLEQKRRLVRSLRRAQRQKAEAHDRALLAGTGIREAREASVSSRRRSCWPGPLTVDDEHSIALHGIGRHQQRIVLLAGDDIGLDAHARLKRRIVRQRRLDAEGLRGHVAHRRDLADLALEAPVGKRIGAKQHDLPEPDARNVLFIDLGDHLQRRRHADAEQDLPGFGDFADFAVRRKTTPSIGATMV